MAEDWDPLSAMAFGSETPPPPMENGIIDGLYDPVPVMHGTTAEPQLGDLGFAIGNDMMQPFYSSPADNVVPYQDPQAEQAPQDAGSSPEAVGTQERPTAPPVQDAPKSQQAIFQEWDPLSIAQKLDPQAFQPGGIPLTQGQQIKLAFNEAANLIATVFHNEPMIQETRLFRQGFEQSQEKLLQNRQNRAMQSGMKQVEMQKFQVQQQQIQEAAKFRARQVEGSALAGLMGKNLGYLKDGKWTPAEDWMLKSLAHEAAGGGADGGRPPLFPQPEAEKIKAEVIAREGAKASFDASPEGRAAAAREQADAANKAAASKQAEIDTAKKNKTLVENDKGQLVSPAELRQEETTKISPTASKDEDIRAAMTGERWTEMPPTQKASIIHEAFASPATSNAIKIEAEGKAEQVLQEIATDRQMSREERVAAALSIYKAPGVPETLKIKIRSFVDRVNKPEQAPAATPTPAIGGQGGGLTWDPATRSYVNRGTIIGVRG